MSYQAHIVISTIDTDKSYQTILVPDFSVSQVLHREFVAGQRGRGSAWGLAPISKPCSISTANTRTVTFTITDKELAGLRAGIYTSIGVKAQQAMEQTPANPTNQTHTEVVSSLVENAQPVAQPVAEPVAQPVITQQVAQPVQVAQAPTVHTVATSNKVATRQTNLATIPDKKWADEYLNRKVVSNLTEFDIYDKAMETRTNVLITGHAGSGKTMSVMAYASARGMKFYSVSAHAGIDVSQVFGKFNPTGDPDEPFAWFDGGLTQCIREGNAVLLFNEVNFLPERFTTVVFSLLDDRREISLMDKDGEVIRAGNNLLIVGDMNPNTAQYRGTRQLSSALADRFAHRITFDYDQAIERKLIPNSALLEMAQQLRARFDKEELVTPISTRSLVAFYRNMAVLGFDYAKYSYLNSFSDVERPSVAMVIETHESNIKAGN